MNALEWGMAFLPWTHLLSAGDSSVPNLRGARGGTAPHTACCAAPTRILLVPCTTFPHHTAATRTCYPHTHTLPTSEHVCRRVSVEGSNTNRTGPVNITASITWFCWDGPVDHYLTHYLRPTTMTCLICTTTYYLRTRHTPPHLPDVLRPFCCASRPSPPGLHHALLRSLNAAQRRRHHATFCARTCTRFRLPTNYLGSTTCLIRGVPHPARISGTFYAALRFASTAPLADMRNARDHPSLTHSCSA